VSLSYQEQLKLVSISFSRTIHTCFRLFLKNSSHLCPSLSQEELKLVSISFSRSVHTFDHFFLKNSSNLCPSLSQEQFTLLFVSFSRTVQTCDLPKNSSKLPLFLRTIQIFVCLYLKNNSEICFFLSWEHFKARTMSYLGIVKHCISLLGTAQNFFCLSVCYCVVRTIPADGYS